MKTFIQTFLKNYAFFSAFFLLSIPVTAQVEQIYDSTARLYLLQEMSNPVSTSLESVICAFNYNSSLHIITGANAFYIPSENYLSLDQCENDLETIAVEGGVSMRLWHHNFGNNCIEAMSIPIIPWLTDSGSSYYFQYPVSVKGTPAPVEGEKIINELIIICE